MEKEVVWSKVAERDFWDIVSYLSEQWPEEVLNRFYKSIQLKIVLIGRHPNIGFKSSQNSKYRRTLILKHYILIYTIKADHILIVRLKHSSQSAGLILHFRLMCKIICSRHLKFY